MRQPGAPARRGSGITEYRSLRQFFAFDSVYANLRKSAGVPTTDELTLFAVDAGMRGHGVGMWLFADYLGPSASPGSPRPRVT